jgi:uncharacterized membrane protein
MRLLKHCWLDAADAHTALGRGTLERVQERVRQSELRHGGEIRVCVEAGLPLRDLWRGTHPRQRALAVFSELGVWDTEDNNGVLIYLLVADHAIEIVADRGVARHVPAPQWQAVVQGMSKDFKAGRYEQGLHAAVDAVSHWLEQHFPLQPGEPNPNQLPDRPVVR